jgi:glycosyltransferase involved in cell wall biosynthesis
VAFVTYGDKRDQAYADRLPGIKILSNTLGIPDKLYRVAAPLIHMNSIRACDIVKSNQMRGAAEALRAARLAGKPLVARCGYMWSDLAANRVPQRRGEYGRAVRTEKRVFSRAARVSVTTLAMRDYAMANHGIAAEKIHVIPNYVLSGLFKPADGTRAGKRICFIGRLHPDKNPLALVRACAGLDVELLMVGDGPLRAEIIQTAERANTNVKLLGSVPYLELPQLLQSCAMFALVSPHEGHPKTLIEAMSCGLAVIGADSPGIREQIVHGETGWSCQGDPNSIRDAVQYLGDRPELRARLGRNAREYVLKNFTLDRIVDLELALLDGVTRL